MEQMKSTRRLQQLIHRTDRVLAVLHAPSVAHARLMEAAGAEVVFVGTSGNELDPDFAIMAQCYARDAANGGLAECLRRLQACEQVAGVDWVQFESPHTVEEIRQARSMVAGPFSFMRGKLPDI